MAKEFVCKQMNRQKNHSVLNLFFYKKHTLIFLSSKTEVMGRASCNSPCNKVLCVNLVIG